jgi:hypothetical protein
MMAHNEAKWRNNLSHRNPQTTDSRRPGLQQCELATRKPIHVEIDFEEAAAVNDTLYKHQVVISFDGRVNSTQAREWIDAYNKLHTSHTLRFQEPLIHSLFVVVVHSVTPSATVD